MSDRLHLPTVEEAGKVGCPAGRHAVTTAEDVHRIVRGYPHASFERGQILYDFIREHGLRRVLELGVNQGVSTCYAAAAVASLGTGTVVAIDQYQAAAYRPGVVTFAQQLGLEHIIVPFFERKTYNWRLRSFLAMTPRPAFDLVFIDGGHQWEPDALAFLLTDRLLRPGGWWIFDDISWSISGSRTAVERMRKLPIPPGEDEIAARPVRDIVDLLVRPHPNVESWREDEQWGFARKRRDLDQSETSNVDAELRRTADELSERARRAFPLPIEIAPDLDSIAWLRAVQEGLKRNAKARKQDAARRERRGPRFPWTLWAKRMLR
jgi:predicted O-methyltransferase YrrM